MTGPHKRLDDLKIDHGDDELEPRRPWLVWVTVGIVAGMLAVGAWWLMRPRSPEVTTTAVLERAVAARAAVLDASGYVTARRQATVSSKVTAKIVAVLIEEGMAVEEGALLARLDDATQRAALDLAAAQVAAASSAREETRVRLAEALLELQRARDLVAGKIASQQELDRAQAEVDAQAARLAVQEDQLEVARRQLGVRQQDLADTEIRAPFAGIVVTKDAQPGEMISPVSAGGGFTRTGIGTIVDMASLEIEVDVNEAYIHRVQPEQPVEAVLDAYPEWTIPARVITIVPTADRQKATVRVRIAFEAADPRILPDMGVKVAFIGEEAAANARRLVVPRAALRRDGDHDIVLIVEADRVERRAVRVGLARGEEVELLSGVAAGERVVVEGPAELTDNMTVKEIRG